ncbi:MAG TPA: ribose-phosphate pyrophosphokinase [bacterium]|nr:ribose-phosphate pyrophosphokinase [bacterium]
MCIRDRVQLAFKRCPLEELHLSQELADHFTKHYDKSNCTVCSPDFGAYGRAERTANLLSLPLIVLRKVRKGTDTSTIEIIGDIQEHVANRNIIIREDICGTGGTLVEAASCLRENGARKVYVLLSHLDLCKGNEEEMRRAKERIIQNEIKVIATNTIPHNFTEDEKKHFDIVDIAPLIADIISVHSKGGSISRFFEDRLHQKPDLQ